MPHMVDTYVDWLRNCILHVSIYSEPLAALTPHDNDDNHKVLGPLSYLIRGLPISLDRGSKKLAFAPRPSLWGHIWSKMCVFHLRYCRYE